MVYDPAPITNIQVSKIADWLANNNGNAVHPKYAALKALEEVVELCIASGADYKAIMRTVESETQKADVRSDWRIAEPPRGEELKMELGDSFACLIVVALRNSISIREVIDMCIARIERREWAPDRFGILRRPK